ncbi:MAG: ATP-binding protein [Verrucomicrobiota bacterium]|nr:ATP-binding protein [Verrucomicrobiota bacterium]MEC8330416.1 ATP-binding protein [Verrucomicrobiota bacterium]MEC8649616.1 ATP-binding protein [Verrucomicrobiota bacterium]
MNWFVSIVLLAVSIALFCKLARLRALLRDIEVAISDNRRLQPQLSKKTLERLGAVKVIDSLNALINSRASIGARKMTRSNRAEALLGAVQEAIIVFNAEKIIEYANSAAKDLLREGKRLKGLHLNKILQSVPLLEYLKAIDKDELVEPRQIEIKRGQETLWLEVTSAKVKASKPKMKLSTLLILYDISKLKKLEVTRREFVANVSHELKTPLTIIKGFAEALNNNSSAIKSSDRDKFAKKIYNNAERLHLLVEDLLTLARLESHSESIDRSYQPLVPLFEEVVEGYIARLNPEKQVMLLDVDQAIGDVYFDRFRIQQVLDNIIENVFRYAPAFSKMELKARLKDDDSTVECIVTDDGPGIAEKDLQQIFERFHRVDVGRSRERGGTGLGLSIVKHIIQQHGGNVFARSKIGEGTSIHFNLPVEKT